MYKFAILERSLSVTLRTSHRRSAGNVRTELDKAVRVELSFDATVGTFGARFWKALTSRDLLSAGLGQRVDLPRKNLGSALAFGVAARTA